MGQRRFESISDYGKDVRKRAYLSAFLLCLIGAKPLPKDTESLNLEAGHVEIQDRLQKAIFTGSVRANQGDMTITASAATVSYSGNVISSSKKLELKRVVANVHVTIKRPYETATGNWAIYNLSDRTIIMIGNVELNRPTGSVNGGRLSINLDNNLAIMNSSPVNAPSIEKSGAVDSGRSGRSGRVTGTFSVPQKGQVSSR